MMLTLAACPNPDYPRPCWEAQVTVPPRQIEVGDIEDARQKCFDFIRKHELGGGNWPSASGVVSDRSGRQIGRFSYNLRWWPTAT